MTTVWKFFLIIVALPALRTTRLTHKKSAISVKQATIGTVFTEKIYQQLCLFNCSGKFFYQDMSFFRQVS
ncbi:hypothetical protein NIES2107_68890 (plasmid) [Nostoc carneum NIES-2107]|nr:hypothetical protein NIES2107_68890 [Nostoc carneum NIES-2107]